MRDFGPIQNWLSRKYLKILDRHSHWPLPGRKHDFRIRPSGFPQPVVLRPNTSDLKVFCDVFRSCDYAAIDKWLADRPRHILDLGGNIGLSVRYWQQRFPDANILMVEPDAGNLRQAKKNVLIGPAPSLVRFCRGFAAATAGAAVLDRAGGEWGFRMAAADAAAAASERIDTFPVGELIDSLVGAKGRIDLLKCDVEGAEQQIFSECQGWINRVGTLVVETHLPYTPESLLADIEKCGGRIAQSAIERKAADLSIVWALALRSEHGASPS